MEERTIKQFSARPICVKIKVGYQPYLHFRVDSDLSFEDVETHIRNVIKAHNVFYEDFTEVNGMGDVNWYDEKKYNLHDIKIDTLKEITSKLLEEMRHLDETSHSAIMKKYLGEK